MSAAACYVRQPGSVTIQPTVAKATPCYSLDPISDGLTLHTDPASPHCEHRYKHGLWQSLPESYNNHLLLTYLSLAVIQRRGRTRPQYV